MNVDALNAYSPYGHTANNSNTLGFNGEFQDACTGLYPLGNGYRMYSATLKRFCSPDNLSPFGEGGLNAYAYCLGDPINKVDRNGHFIDVLKSTGKTINRLVTPGKLPFEEFPPIRKWLDKEVDQTTQWGKVVFGVNRILGSHGDTNIPIWKAISYAKTSKSASKGLRWSKSETSLFWGTIPEWMQVARESLIEGSTDKLGAAIVGGLANFGGGFLGAGYDHKNRILGRSLSMPAEETAASRTK